MVGGTFRAICRWILILWVLVHQVFEDHGFLTWLPNSTVRKVPTGPAWRVATIEMSSLGGVPLISWALVGATVLEDNRPPCGATVAITSSTSTRLGANDGL